MYEKVGVFILSLLLLITCLLTNRDMEYSRREYNNLREQLNRATEQQQRLTDEIRGVREGIGECIDIARDSEDLYRQSFSTIHDLKEGLRILRTNYEAMEDRLYKLNDSLTNNNNNNME